MPNCSSDLRNAARFGLAALSPERLREIADHVDALEARRRPILAFVCVGIFAFAVGVLIRDYRQDWKDAEFVLNMQKASLACQRHGMTLAYESENFNCIQPAPIWTGKPMRMPIKHKGKR